MKLYKVRKLIPFLSAPFSVFVFGVFMQVAMAGSEATHVFSIGYAINLLPKLICLLGFAWMAYTAYRVTVGQLPSGTRFCTRCGGDLNFIHTKDVSFSVCKSCGTTYRD